MTSPPNSSSNSNGREEDPQDINAKAVSSEDSAPATELDVKSQAIDATAEANRKSAQYSFIIIMAAFALIGGMVSGVIMLFAIGAFNAVNFDVQVTSIVDKLETSATAGLFGFIAGRNASFKLI
jgi:hypothetical protein